MSGIKAAFLGTGNMGGALASAAARGENDISIILADIDTEKASALEKKIRDDCPGFHGSLIVADGKTAAAEADFIFLGIKPQFMESALSGIKEALAKRDDRFVIVSMAAGLEIETIRKMSGGDYPVIRIMPNLPASIGKGVILYTSNADVTEAEMAAFLDFMAAAGTFVKFDEKLFDAGTSVSGCGPAFVYMFIEALADAGVSLGIKRDDALLLAAGTVEGAAGMVLCSGEHPGRLKDNVCSPGGSTIEGVKALEACGFRGDVIDAVCASYNKNLSLK